MEKCRWYYGRDYLIVQDEKLKTKIQKDYKPAVKPPAKYLSAFGGFSPTFYVGYVSIELRCPFEN